MPDRRKSARASTTESITSPNAMATKPPPAALHAFAKAYLLLHLQTHLTVGVELSPIPPSVATLYSRKAWREAMRHERRRLLDDSDILNADGRDGAGAVIEGRDEVALDCKGSIRSLYAEHEDADDRCHTTTLAYQDMRPDRVVKSGESDSQEDLIGFKEEAAGDESRQLIEKAIAEIREWDVEAGEKMAAALGLVKGSGVGDGPAEGKEQAAWPCVVC